MHHLSDGAEHRNCDLKHSSSRRASCRTSGKESVFSETRDQTADVADQVKSAAEDLYGQAKDSTSQMADAAGRSMKIARNTASSLEDVVRNTIENQP